MRTIAGRWRNWSVQLRAFESDPALEMVFGQALQLQNGPEWEAGVRDNQLAVAGMVPGMVPGTMLIKRDAFLRVGKFQGDWKVGEFIDWYARAVELQIRSLVLPELLLWRRIHDSNQGVRERQSVSDYARVLKAKLDRKRAGGDANVGVGATADMRRNLRSRWKRIAWGGARLCERNPRVFQRQRVSP